MPRHTSVSAKKLGRQQQPKRRVRLDWLSKVIKVMIKKSKRNSKKTLSRR